MLLKTFEDRKLIQPPRWLAENTFYLTQMGSVSYGVSSDASDIDVYGFCIPPKHVVFPHLAGVIPGFGTQPEQFNSWQQHHVQDVGPQKEYDFTIFSIVKMFDLAMANNPNVIDSLFTSRECVLHSTQVSELVRDRRREFLHKGAMHKLRGYAYSGLNKIKGKPKVRELANLCQKYNIPTSVRLEDVDYEISMRPSIKGSVRATSKK